MNDTLEIVKVPHKLAHSWRQTMPEDFMFINQILCIADGHWINTELGGPIFIAVDRRMTLEYHNRKFGNDINIWLGVEGDTFIFWAHYKDYFEFSENWNILYEFPRVLIEKTGFYI